MNEIQIGSQIWASENLKAITFRNGESIPQVIDLSDWASHIGSGYHIIDDNYYYNFDVVVDSRNVAPIGWRVPTENDWNILINYVGGKDIAGYNLKSIDGWEFTGQTMDGQVVVHNFGGSDEFGFLGKSTGFIHINGDFGQDPLAPYFIPQSIDETLAKYCFLFQGSEFGINGMWKKDGFPIRLIKE